MAAGRKSGGLDFAIDTLVVAVTQLLLKLRSLVTLPLIVKLLGTVMYGVWAQTLAFTGFLGSLLSLNLHLPLVRFAAADPKRLRSIYSTMLAATLVLTGAGVAVVWLFADAIGPLLLDEVRMAPYLKLGMLAMLCSNIRILNINVYRATNRLFLRSMAELVLSFGELVGIFILLHRGHGLLTVLAFIAIWEGAIIGLMTAHVFTITGFGRPEKSVLLEALHYALPLLPSAFSMWALDRLDRFVIGWFDGARGVGIYSANYAFAGLLMLFQTPFQITLLPKVSALWDVDREKARRYIEISNKLFLTFAIPFVIGVPVIAEPVLRLLANADIAAASGWITLLISAGILFWGIGVLQLQIFHGARQTWIVGAVTVGAAVLNLALNLALVPPWGVMGAALATLVAYGATCAVFAWFSKDIMRIDFDPVYLLRCVVASGIMAAFLWIAAPRRPWMLVAAMGGAALLYGALLWLLRRALPARGDTDPFDLLRSLVGRMWRRAG